LRSQDLVAAGYDRIADHYAEWPGGADIRERYLARLTGLVPPGGRVLDLGCGNGIPVARELSALAHVVGIDVSPRQIELARRNVPAGHFIAADMMDVELAAGEYDAVCAFFSVTHVPRRLHSELFARVRAWLGDGGWFLASLGAGDEPDSVEPNWLGAPMFFSHFDAATNCDLIRAAGLQVVESAIVAHEEAGRTATFLWVIARKA
jgi:cyclopropane fatty-acyl-phospholipid synthase-like methyltransferase